jgi:hypothetical protein
MFPEQLEIAFTACREEEHAVLRRRARLKSRGRADCKSRAVGRPRNTMDHWLNNAENPPIASVSIHYGEFHGMMRPGVFGFPILWWLAEC